MSTLDCLSLKNTAEYLQENVSSKLLSGLYTQRRTGKFCDVKILVGDTSLWTHSCVLSTFSARLHNIFVTKSGVKAKGKRSKSKTYVNWSLNNPLEVKLSDLYSLEDSVHQECLDCVDKVIDFLYHGRICIDHNHIDHIESLGKVFSVSELSNICQQARMQASENTPALATNIVHDPPTDIVTNESVPAKNSGRSYTCLGCGITQRNAASLLKHLRESAHDNHSLTCSLCLRYTAPNTSNLIAHLNLHDHALPFFCLACDARFRTRTALSSHEPRHSTETPFLCGECGRGFKWKHALRSHALVHSEEKRHLCDTCGFSTAHISTFRTHRMVHAGVCFRCPQPNCNFVATRKQSLAHHVATHSKERHYQCEVCGQSFSMYKNLRRHATRHEPSPAGLVCCPIPGCLYANTRLDKIKAHAERHRSGKPVRTLLRPRVRRTTPVPPVSAAGSSPPVTSTVLLETINSNHNNDFAMVNVTNHNDVMAVDGNTNISQNVGMGEDIIIVLPPELSVLTFS